MLPIFGTAMASRKNFEDEKISLSNGSNRNIRGSNLNWNGAPVELNTTQI
jgi:hypothetical protein